VVTKDDKRDEVWVRELVNTAYAVATAPTVGAYRGSGYAKQVGYPAMRALLRVLLDGPLTPEARSEVHQRLDALRARELDDEAYRAKEERESAERAAQREAERHAFVPGAVMGRQCAVCAGYPTDWRHTQ
jgi:hypothetical protein